VTGDTQGGVFGARERDNSAPLVPASFGSFLAGARKEWTPTGQINNHLPQQLSSENAKSAAFQLRILQSIRGKEK